MLDSPLYDCTQSLGVCVGGGREGWGRVRHLVSSLSGIWLCVSGIRHSLFVYSLVGGEHRYFTYLRLTWGIPEYYLGKPFHFVTVPGYLLHTFI